MSDLQYLNRYRCPACGHRWDEVYSCGCDGECGECGVGDITPLSSNPTTRKAGRVVAKLTLEISPEELAKLVGASSEVTYAIRPGSGAVAYRLVPEIDDGAAKLDAAGIVAAVVASVNAGGEWPDAKAEDVTLFWVGSELHATVTWADQELEQPAE